MNPNYLLAGLLGAFIVWKLLAAAMARRRLPGMLRSGAQVIDVRSAGEFAAGHASGSHNVPLDELDARVQELDRARGVIVCCASGTRSAVARGRLRRLGFTDVLNAGSWRNLP